MTKYISLGLGVTFLFSFVSGSFLGIKVAGERENLNRRNSELKQSSVVCPAHVTKTPLLLPHPEDCGKFYICDHGSPYLKTCQAGLHFNSKVQSCDYPQNANCETVAPDEPEANVVEEESHTICPAKNSGSPILLPHSTDCDKFYLCDNGKAHEKTCQTGLHFNAKIQACDYPNNAKCEGKNKEPRERINDPFSDICSADTSGRPFLFPNPDDCEKFFICENGFVFSQNCPTGLFFNVKTGACDFPKNVECESAIPDEPEGNIVEDEPHTVCPTKSSASPILVPHSTDCDKFYVCDNGKAHPKTCQAGLHFNAKIQSCDYPQNANCKRGDNKEPRERINDPFSDICSADTTGRPFLFPNPEDCETFFICENGIAFPQKCPSSLFFNVKIGACDFPENVKCDSAVTQAPVGKIKEEQSICPKGKSILLPDPENCDQFIMCEKGVAHPHKCPKGLHFNPKKQVCDYPSNVNCHIEIQNAAGFPSPFCPSFNGKVQIFFRHPTNCSVYYMCSNGLAYEFACPARLHFNLRKKFCDYENEAGCQAGDIVD